MRGIVLFFRDDTKHSEHFVFPNITKVVVTIEGVPNSLYAGGNGVLKQTELFHEAEAFFLDDTTDTLTPTKFYTDSKFEFVIDMQTVNDKKVSDQDEKY